MFISIKWKAVIFLSVVLISLTTAWIWQTIEKTISWHEKQQIEKTLVAQFTLQKIVIGNFLQLSSLVSLLPTQENLAPVLQKNIVNREQLNNHLEESWFQLSLNSGVDYVAFFDNHYELLAQKYNLDTLSQTSTFTVSIKKRIQNNIENTPDNFIYCENGCMQVVIEPVILPSGKQVFVVLGQNMSFVTQLFASFSSDRLAILLPNEGLIELEESKQLNAWQRRIWALSDFDNTFPILKSFSEHQAMGNIAVRHDYKKRIMMIRKISGKQFNFLGTRPDFVVIIDETQSYRQLNDSIFNGVVTGVAALLISELILIILIMGKVKQLINIAKALKLLPQFEYEKARIAISNKTSFFRDEISSLKKSTLYVTNSLEQLHDDVKEKKLSLEDQVNVLSRSRSFLSRLLDNSQLFILTQTFEAKVLTRNIRVDEILAENTSCFTHCSSAKDTSVINQTLQQLKSGVSNRVNHECHCYDLHGKEVYIAWTHTTVENEQGQTVVLSIGTDLTKRKEAERALTWMANNDPLTGISNRRGFQQKIDELVSTQSHFSLVFIDVNRFKQINDIYGHSVGDKVLVNIAKQLKLITRQTDHISRLAGDEFTILLTRTSLKEIEVVLVKIADALQNQINLEDGSVLEYSTSLGASVFPSHAENSESLIIYADMAMYQAKKKTGSHWHIYKETDEHLTNIKIEHHYFGMIRSALKNEQFRLVFQPIVDINSSDFKHFEVLLRILSDDGRLVFPGEFIPIAEKNGLIRSIDEWVLDNALKILSENMASHTDLSFGVNISAPSLQSTGFPELVHANLQKYHLPAERLIIELTETAYIENFNQVLDNLNELNSYGVKVALDDFGVGFSSFNYLKRLPLSYVKLDGSYIKNLCENEDDQAFVKSISEMVQAFGMKTIAEFVEDQNTMNLLKSLGVNYAQGYHIGRPEESINFP